MRTPSVIKGLGGRLFLYQIAALAMLLGAFGLLSLQTASRAQSQALSQEIDLAQAVAKGLQDDLDHISSDILSYFLTYPPTSDVAGTLASLEEHLVTQEGLRFFNPIGVHLVDASSSALASSSYDDFTLEAIQQAIATGNPRVLPLGLSTGGEGDPYVLMVVPLGSSALPGEDVVAVEMTGIANVDLFSFNRVGSSEESASPQVNKQPYVVEVLSPDGVVLTTSMGARFLGTTSFHYAVMKDYLDKGGPGAIVHKPGNGRPSHIVAGAPVGNSGLFLVMEEPQGLLLDWPLQLRDQAVLLGGIAAAIIVVLGWVVDRQIVQPLRNLRHAATRIKEGDLETPLRVKAPGEMGALAAEVDAMRGRLKDSIFKLEDLTGSLANQIAERTDRLQSVLQRLMDAQEEERRRIARDLHDETAQGLSALGMLLDEAAITSEADGKLSLESISRARKQVGRLMEETRRLVYALRPSVLDDAGLIPALRWCAEAYLESSGVQVSFQVTQPEVRLPELVEVTLFRVGQEAMSNIARHAQASCAWVTLERQDKWVILTIKDDGIGFDKQATAWLRPEPGSGHGFGLVGMQERLALLGGKVDINSSPGQGTTVTVQVPRETIRE